MESSFAQKCYIITDLNFFLERFGRGITKIKNAQVLIGHIPLCRGIRAGRAGGVGELGRAEDLLAQPPREGRGDVGSSPGELDEERLPAVADCLVGLVQPGGEGT